MPMTDREKQLIENVEDAKFSLLLYRMSLANGRKLDQKNEELKEDDSFSVPERIDVSAHNTIKKEFAKKDARKTARVFGKVISKVAVVVLVVNIIFITSFSTASAFRSGVLNFLFTTFGEGTSVTLGQSAGEAAADDGDAHLGWLPENLVQTLNDDWGTVGFDVVYEGSDGSFLDFTKFLGDGLSNVDTEDADIVRKIVVLDHNGIYIKKGEENTAIWGDTHTGYVYSVISIGISADDFEKIIKNIK